MWYRGGLVFEAHRLSLRLKDLLGPVTGVKKKKKVTRSAAPTTTRVMRPTALSRAIQKLTSSLRGTNLSTSGAEKGPGKADW